MPLRGQRIETDRSPYPFSSVGDPFHSFCSQPAEATTAPSRDRKAGPRRNTQNKELGDPFVAAASDRRGQYLLCNR